MKLEAIATDVDGTLTDMMLRISCAAIQAIRKAEEQGVSVLLVSGNALHVLRTLKNYIGCSGALVAEAGAVIEYDGELRVLGDKEEPTKALAVLKRKLGRQIQELWSNQFRYADVALKRTVEKETILEVLKGFPNLKLLDSGLAYHIQSRNFNKGKGLTVAAQLMNIPVENMAAIGDSSIDMELLQKVGYGIALSNAPPTLTSVAKYITSKNDGEGFAEAVNFLLSKFKGSYSAT